MVMIPESREIVFDTLIDTIFGVSSGHTLSEITECAFCHNVKYCQTTHLYNKDKHLKTVIKNVKERKNALGFYTIRFPTLDFTFEEDPDCANVCNECLIKYEIHVKLDFIDRNVCFTLLNLPDKNQIGFVDGARHEIDYCGFCKMAEICSVYFVYQAREFPINKIRDEIFDLTYKYVDDNFSLPEYEHTGLICNDCVYTHEIRDSRLEAIGYY